ncbi:hypothetical protein EDD15DRAFT_2521614 [Pisolithus albus]|nr:hypothetical protein EDD15DRAFT_2521614 [Pisolithus albus]
MACVRRRDTYFDWLQVPTLVANTHSLHTSPCCDWRSNGSTSSSAMTLMLEQAGPHLVLWHSRGTAASTHPAWSDVVLVGLWPSTPTLASSYIHAHVFLLPRGHRSHVSAPQTSANYDDERGNFPRHNTSTLTGLQLFPSQDLERRAQFWTHATNTCSDPQIRRIRRSWPRVKLELQWSFTYDSDNVWVHTCHGGEVNEVKAVKQHARHTGAQDEAISRREGIVGITTRTVWWGIPGSNETYDVARHEEQHPTDHYRRPQLTSYVEVVAVSWIDNNARSYHLKVKRNRIMSKGCVVGARTRLLATISSKQDDSYSYRNDSDTILSAPNTTFCVVLRFYPLSSFPVPNLTDQLLQFVILAAKSTHLITYSCPQPVGVNKDDKNGRSLSAAPSAVTRARGTVEVLSGASSIPSGVKRSMRVSKASLGTPSEICSPVEIEGVGIEGEVVAVSDFLDISVLL